MAECSRNSDQAFSPTAENEPITDKDKAMIGTLRTFSLAAGELVLGNKAAIAVRRFASLTCRTVLAASSQDSYKSVEV